MKNWIGIDPSHETFSAAFPQAGSESYRTQDYDQSEAAFDQFLCDLPENAAVIVEETGTFSARLLLFLHQHLGSVYVASSHQINGFRHMIGSRAKNDALDAIAIARYGQMICPPAWQPKSDFMIELRQLAATEALLVKQQTALKNQLFSFRLDPQTSPIVIQNVEQILKVFKQKIKELEQAITQLVNEHMPAQQKLLRSIPGLGARTIPALLAVVQDFNRFDSARQLAAFLGLTPTTFRSGKSVRRKPKISKVGPAYLRKLLYMCACSAIQYNPLCKEFYHQLLKKGKKKHSALLAVAHKLVRIAFGVIKNQQPFDPKFLAKI